MADKNGRVYRRSMTPDRPGGARLGRQRYFELTSRCKLPISNAPEDFRHGPVVYVGIPTYEWRASLQQCRRTTYKENLSVSFPSHLRRNPDVANRSGACYPRRHHEAGEPVIRREREFPPRRVTLHRLELIEGVWRFSPWSQLLPFYWPTTVERTFRDADQSGLKCFFAHLNQGAENQSSFVDFGSFASPV